MTQTESKKVALTLGELYDIYNERLRLLHKANDIAKLHSGDSTLIGAIRLAGMQQLQAMIEATEELVLGQVVSNFTVDGKRIGNE